MKTLSFCKRLFCVACILAASSLCHSEEATEAAVAAARAWLVLVDAGEYNRSWQEAAPFLQNKVSEAQWLESITSVRKPLGASLSRQLHATQFTTRLPGAPEAEYVVVQFRTRFAQKSDAVETIVPMKVDGAWRVSGYYIK